MLEEMRGKNRGVVCVVHRNADEDIWKLALDALLTSNDESLELREPYQHEAGHA